MIFVAIRAPNRRRRIGRRADPGARVDPGLIRYKRGSKAVAATRIEVGIGRWGREPGHREERYDGCRSDRDGNSGSETPSSCAVVATQGNNQIVYCKENNGENT